ncbi:MAG: MmgE/PrpD family protein [Fimbriimonadaceae bacterium]|nr:MmgE/PrpD family protein [Fimbriimonadaceae bacterium]
MSSNYPGVETAVILGRDTNQALGIGQYAIDALAGSLGPGPSSAVLLRTSLFHTDAVLCGASALALGTNAPNILREEALEYGDDHGATVFKSHHRVKSEKAVVANSAAVREWDSNGTNFGFRPEFGHTAGEFGHNDFYPVVIAACQEEGHDGAKALHAMIVLDEIRGRLAEVYSLKSYKIDHVVHGAIASAAVYGALRGATAEQIESAIGMVVAHYIPWRAIRAGKQLSDSKGSSAAISSEVAVLSMKRSMRRFMGPRDIFRNPEAVFRQFEPTNGDSPFDLVLSHSGDDFAIMGMHFKLGLYEHQSAGALQGVIDLVRKEPSLLDNAGAGISKILIRAYEPAFGIIGDPAKRDPKTRQSADHSMVFIVSRLLRNAILIHASDPDFWATTDNDTAWKEAMLMPIDYDDEALTDSATRELMAKIEFEHGGPDYDARYPDGIPTSVVISNAGGSSFDSGLVMYPSGHARNTTANLLGILGRKFERMAELAFGTELGPERVAALERLPSLSAGELMEIYG